MTPSTRLFWAANVRTKPFAERIAAAAAHGYDAVSLFPLDVRQAADGGTGPADMRRQAEAAGVRIDVLDPLTSWTPGWAIPDGMSADDAAFIDFDPDTFFGYAEALGVRSVNLIESVGAEIAPAEAAEAFGRICDRAAGLGMQVQLEFMPFSGIPDLATAWDLIQRADRPNAGLTFDTWHYHRGTPDLALLRSIPGDRIYQVQVADAAETVVGDLTNDLLHYRLLPGDGSFPLVETVGALREIGGLSSVGTELFSDAMDRLSPDAVARLTAVALDVMLDEVDRAHEAR